MSVVELPKKNEERQQAVQEILDDFKAAVEKGDVNGVLVSYVTDGGMARVVYTGGVKVPYLLALANHDIQHWLVSSD